MKQKTEMICISCPIGCRLQITPQGDTITVTGNRCKRGEEYANEEWFAPKRMVTATCAVAGASGPLQRVPVRTTEPLPAEHIDTLLHTLHRRVLEPPIERGAVIESDVAGTGVDVIASHRVDAPPR